ncbi:MAG: protein kinase, partial [Acidobacteriota bacterium]
MTSTDPTAPDDPARRTVGPYQLDALIGRGGIGEVWRAHDRRLGRDVAIKQLRPERAADPRARARMQREAQALAQLSHPAIVPIFDLIDDDAGDWIVMELIEGPSVAERLADGPLPLAQALEFGAQIARGLAAAHARGILHRDLKTENVLTTHDGQARIVDFGLAKPLWDDGADASLSIEGAIVGTCRAMSPEQARGLAIDERSDLFALGTLLYEMLSGISPFRAPTALDTLTRVCTHDPPPLDQVARPMPRAVADLVAHLLNKAPERRPADAATVADAIDRLRASPAVTDFGGRNAARRDPSSTTSPSRDASASEDAVATGETVFTSEVWTPANTAAASPSVAAPPTASRARRRGPIALLLLTLAIALVAVAIVRFAPRAATSDGVATALAAARGADDAADGAAAASADAAAQTALDLLIRYDEPGTIDRAIAMLLRAVESDRQSAIAYAVLARAYWLKYRNSGRDRQWLTLAEPAAQRAVALAPSLPEAGVSQGFVQLARGEHAAAERTLRGVLVQHPAHADAHQALGRVHLAQRRFDDAERAYRFALAAAPEDPWMWARLGILYFRTQRLDAAADAFRRSIALRPDSVYARRNLAGVLQMQGQIDDAIRELQAALAIHPEATLFTNLGALRFAQGHYGEAAEAFERALDTGTLTHDSQTWANLADAYRWLPGREDDARSTYRRAIQLARRDLDADPDNLTQRSRLAQYLAKAAERDDALAEAERVAEVAASREHLDAAVLYRQAVTWELLGLRQR